MDMIGTILSENTSEIILRNWFENLLWSGAIFYHISQDIFFFKKKNKIKNVRPKTEPMLVTLLLYWYTTVETFQYMYNLL